MLHSHTSVSYQLRECSYPKVYLRKILPLGHFLSSVPYIFMKLATWMFLELQVSSGPWATLVLNVFTCGVSLLWILKRGWGHLGCFLSLLLGSSTCPRTICWGRASVSQQSGLRFFYCLWVTKDTSPAFFNLFLLWLLIILCNHSCCLWVAWAYKEIQWYMVKLICLLVETFSYTSAGVLPTAIMLELWYAVYEMYVCLLPEQSIKQLLVDRHQLLFREVQHLLYWELWKEKALNRGWKMFDPGEWKALDLLCLLHPPGTAVSLQQATWRIYEGPDLCLKLERGILWLLSL